MDFSKNMYLHENEKSKKEENRRKILYNKRLILVRTRKINGSISILRRSSTFKHKKRRNN